FCEVFQSTLNIFIGEAFKFSMLRSENRANFWIALQDGRQLPFPFVGCGGDARLVLWPLRSAKVVGLPGSFEFSLLKLFERSQGNVLQPLRNGPGALSCGPSLLEELFRVLAGN